MNLSKFSLVASLVVLASSVSAIAAPKVGDIASFEGSMSGSGYSVKIVAEQKITAINANTGVYTVHQTQTIGTETQEADLQVGDDDMLTEEKGAAVVSICEAQNIGKNERITVRSGTFDACRVSSADGTTLWIAAVPFGLVKMQSSVDAGTLVMEAVGFVRGK